jgi:hypothetical protein
MAVLATAVAKRSSDRPDIRLEISMNHLGWQNRCPNRGG